MPDFVTEIHSGGALLVSGGTVIMFDDSPIEIKFGSSTERLKLILEFKSSEDKPNELRVEPEAIDKNTLKLKLLNFSNNLGAGTKAPIPIGNLGGKKLSFTFRVYALGDAKELMIHYNLYQYGST